MDGHLYFMLKSKQSSNKMEKYKWDSIQWTRGPATYSLLFYYLLAYAPESTWIYQEMSCYKYIFKTRFDGSTWNQTDLGLKPGRV